MIEFAASSHPGLQREINEDCFAADGKLNLWLVTDGVGGHAHGEVAAAIARDTVVERFSQGMELTQCIVGAHEAVLREAASRTVQRGMGTTVVAMSLREGHYDIAWVGDSRAYLWDGLDLSQITCDHSQVQALLSQGSISAAEARCHPERNVLTQSLGMSSRMQLQPERAQGVLAAGQQIILCSDGLNDELSGADIARQMRGQLTVQGQVDGLVNAALGAGGHDNITVIVVGSAAAAPGAGPAPEPDMETTQDIGLATGSSSDKRVDHSVKIWLIAGVLFTLIALFVWL